MKNIEVITDEVFLAKNALDNVIKKTRVHWYKPIQIAEILYKHRQEDSNLDLLKLEDYRISSKRWRDDICLKFIGRVSTSSSKYQDNLFEKNAIPPNTLAVLGSFNSETNGWFEKYLYLRFETKFFQLNNALSYEENKSKKMFILADFMGQFWNEPGLKRSVDKIFEIVVYSLFEVLVTNLDVKIDVYFSSEKLDIINEFAEFAKKVLNLDTSKHRKTLNAHFHRVGVTNAADRGLDLYANFGTVVQVKHLSLDENLANNEVDSVSANKIIIVCKEVEQNIILSLLNQVGWKSRIQAVITIDELGQWYDKALRGKYADELGDLLLETIQEGITTEFPSLGNADFNNFKKTRAYTSDTEFMRIKGLFEQKHSQLK